MPNSEQSVTRRLAAILVADVVGYTRMMERDDTGTFSRLRTIRDEVVDPAIVSHGGRIVKTAGDGLLAEFPSALSALRTAVQIQREMASRNADVAAEERIDYRIGVNLGDIMVEAGDIAGDGVNVASRLESLAEPGAICVSGSVREQVHGTLDVGFVDMGEQQVKNIVRPIRAWGVAIEGLKTPESGSRPSSSTVRRTWRWVGALLLVAVAASLAIWLATRTALRTAAAPPMSVAVLPFKVIGNGIVDAPLSDRITQDVISALARGKRSAHVSPVALISEYKAGSVDPRVVGHALNVRYVAEGDIRLAKGGATVITRLYDASSATQLATDSSQVTDVEDSADIQGVAARAVLQIRTALGSAERVRARTVPIDPNLDWLARTGVVLQMGNWSPSAHREALRLVDEVLRRDPDNVSALVRRFWLLNGLYEEDLNADRDRLVGDMDSATNRAVTFDPRDAEAWHARAIAFGWQGRWAEAEAALAEARRLDPDNPEYLEQRTHLLLISGQLEEVKLIVDQVARRTGSYGDREMRDLCWLNLASGSPAAAVPFCAKAAALSDWWADEMYLAAAYAQAGQIDKSKDAAARVIRAQPDITIDLLRKRRYSSHPDYRRWEEGELFAGLRKAGIPEK
jgi:class 3 adenylate cyclase/TolB-like protein